MAETAQAAVAMNDLDAFPNDDVAEYGEEGEYGRECSVSIDDSERNVEDHDAVS